MKFRAVFLDIDDTLFDFRKSSFEALVTAFAEIGVSFTEADMPHYEVYNNRMWEMFERGEIEKEHIYEERFRLYFAERRHRGRHGGVQPEVSLRAGRGREFHAALRRAAAGAARASEGLHPDERRHLCAERRIEKSGFAPYFDGVFISEQLGCKKPEKAFYDKVFSLIGEEYRGCTLMVGDSLSSDMQGGRNAGIPTCFYGKREKADARCDYVIEDLLELPPLLGI